MPKKKASKAKKRVRALKQNDPAFTAIENNEWGHYEPEEVKQAPHSFIFNRGTVGRFLRELVGDLRAVMKPYTATSLKAKKNNGIKDFVSVASYFHVTHMCVITRTELSPYMKICRIPRGPTLTFRILNYTLARDVLASLKKQVTYEMQFHHHPLLILNNFTGKDKHIELTATTFQNMFPSINITNVQLKAIRRVLMLNYNDEDDTIELRHYTITYQPVGVSKAVKKILLGKQNKIPNLGRCQDISEYIARDGEMSESEAEEVTGTVDVTQKLRSRGTKGVDEVAIKLVELGPRMTLQLLKIENGLLDGEVLYHKVQEKTDEEKLQIRKMRALKRNVKEQRKRVQAQNISKKVKQKELHRKKCLEGMGLKTDDADDDASWYRKEVGEEPDQDTFDQSTTTVTKKASNSETKGDEDETKGRRRLKRKFGASRDLEHMEPYRKISKFTKVKEKAKVLKKERQKFREMKMRKSGRGGSTFSGGTGGGGFKGRSTYSKPKGSKGSRKKM